MPRAALAELAVSMPPADMVRLVAGDVIDVRLLNYSNSTLSIPADRLWNWITVQPVAAHVAIGDSMSFAVPDKTFTRVAYSSVLFDDKSEFDASIGRFTAGAAGDYDVCALLWDGMNATAFELDLFVNGTREKGLGFYNLTPGVIRSCSPNGRSPRRRSASPRARPGGRTRPRSGSKRCRPTASSWSAGRTD